MNANPSEADLESELADLKQSVQRQRDLARDTDLRSITDGLANIRKIKIKSRCKLKGHAAKVYALAWSSESDHLLSASQDSTLIVWDTHTKSKTHAIELNCAWTMACAFREQNNLVASAGMDNAASVFVLKDDSSGRLVRELIGHDGFISGVQFASSDQLLTSSSDRTCGLWDINNGQQIRSLKGHMSEVYCLSLQPNSVDGSVNVFATGSADRSLKLWDLRASNSCVLTMFDLHETDINCTSFFPNGNAIATGSDDCLIHLVDIRSASTISSYFAPPASDLLPPPPPTPTTPISQQQQQLSENTTDSSNRPSILVDDPKPTNLADSLGPSGIPVTSIGFSSSGRLMFGGCDNFDCVLWDVLKEQCIDSLHGHENRVQCLGISRNANAIATGSWDSMIRIWN